MLSARLGKKLEGIEKCSRQEHKVRNLFKIMGNSPELWRLAYATMYPNHGALTKGADSITLDGFCEDRGASLRQLLKEGGYRWKPSRRVYIRQANGQRRPLGIQSGDDKLVQEVIKILLERIYEPVFSKYSQGFRPGRSCHTALDAIRTGSNGVKWFVNVNIKGYFDSLDHRVMLSILREHIRDNRFLRLIEKLLKTGYLEEWRYHTTLSGSPQSAVLSPILSNLFLGKLDQFVETELLPKYNRGHRRRPNPSWYRLRDRYIA